MPTKLSFLFWNVGRRQVDIRVSRLVLAYDIDVVILAESLGNPATLAGQLRSADGQPFEHLPEPGTRLLLMSKLPAGSFETVFHDVGTGRLTIRRLVLPPATDLLLAAVHLRSKLHTGEADQLVAAQDVAGEIARAEDHFFHTRTVLVGDFNMNPFEPGVAAASALHGVMTRTSARNETRVVDRRQYRFFYNPMWGSFGDRTDGPPGSYYYRGGQVTYFWNVFDQVLLRPSMMDALEELRILDTDGTSSLLSANGLPDGVDGSDHLPLLFRLSL